MGLTNQNSISAFDILRPANDAAGHMDHDTCIGKFGSMVQSNGGRLQERTGPDSDGSGRIGPVHVLPRARSLFCCITHHRHQLKRFTMVCCVDS